MPDASSELEAQCHSIPRKIFNFIPGNDTRNVGIRSHSSIAVGEEPNAHQFKCHDLLIKGDRMEVNSEQYHFNSEN
jgi:hypothetical protein